MTWAELITAATAGLGAVLGVFNAYRAWLDDRVHLKVLVHAAFTVPAGEPHLSITVRNLSRFAVTVTAVGFELAGTDRHLQIPMPLFTGGERLPVRLEPRTSVTVLQPTRALQNDEARLVTRAYVNTACGHVARSSARAMWKLHVAGATAP